MTEKLRIVYVSSRYSPFVGGVEHTVQRLAEGMKARGHNVAIVCGNPSSKKVEVEEINGIEVRRVPTYSPNNTLHVPRNRMDIENSLGNDLDVVHTHNVHAAISMSPVAVKKTMKPKWKLVYTLHFSTPGYTFFRRALWKFFWKRRVNSGLIHVDAVHSTSLLESNFIMKYFGNAKGKLTLIPWGVDEDVLRHGWKGRDSDYVLYCGRIERYKRIDLAARSVEHVRRQGCDVKFVIVGDGSRSDHFRKVSLRDSSIAYMKPKPREEYLELLSNARAVINLSSAENFNLFLAEACAIGVPIVATPEATAFCPRFANVNCLKPDVVANVIAKAVSDPQSCIFPRTCVPPAWKDAIGEFEKFYVNVLESR